ncbi:MAG: DUF192 domain-containing protein [Bryobacteraceae bacterium]
MRYGFLVLALLVIVSCGQKPESVENFHTRDVTLPNGRIIHAEVAIDVRDMLRGLMFRDSLPPDHGMLFVHQKSGRYSYWMYQMMIPLDTIWMDSQHRIVEIYASAPPCKTVAHKCAFYGGHFESQFELQLGGGMATKYGLKDGDRIAF